MGCEIRIKEKIEKIKSVKNILNMDTYILGKRR